MGQIHPLVARYAGFVPDGPPRALFVQIASRSVHKWNDVSLSFMNVFSKTPYSTIRANNLHVILFSAPDAWLFYFNDEDFRADNLDMIRTLTTPESKRDHDAFVEGLHESQREQARQDRADRLAVAALFLV